MTRGIFAAFYSRKNLPLLRHPATELLLKHHNGPALVIGLVTCACNNEGNKEIFQEDTKMTSNKELTINQLGGISGGNTTETCMDISLFYKLGLITEFIGSLDVAFDWENSSIKVDTAWAKVGITCVSKYVYLNEYYYQGKKITRDEAVKIAEDAMIKGPQIGMII